ncbi:hypothetical protein SDC9_60367 [bioreactor metagenome]|uniref:Uncharacterized protein n=1 Tax=bioreactor metagenome TaxID=1076179 RepID=A0A644XDN3_9ZZZZ
MPSQANGVFSTMVCQPVAATVYVPEYTFDHPVLTKAPKVVAEVCCMSILKPFIAIELAVITLNAISVMSPAIPPPAMISDAS